jgi:hypothetical protein
MILAEVWRLRCKTLKAFLAKTGNGFMERQDHILIM